MARSLVGTCRRYSCFSREIEKLEHTLIELKEKAISVADYLESLEIPLSNTSSK
jgi:hypothetical protein